MDELVHDRLKDLRQGRVALDLDDEPGSIRPTTHKALTRISSPPDPHRRNTIQTPVKGRELAIPPELDTQIDTLKMVRCSSLPSRPSPSLFLKFPHHLVDLVRPVEDALVLLDAEDRAELRPNGADEFAARHALSIGIVRVVVLSRDPRASHLEGLDAAVRANTGHHDVIRGRERPRG